MSIKTILFCCISQSMYVIMLFVVMFLRLCYLLGCLGVHNRNVFKSLQREWTPTCACGSCLQCNIFNR